MLDRSFQFLERAAQVRASALDRGRIALLRRALDLRRDGPQVFGSDAGGSALDRVGVQFDLRQVASYQLSPIVWIRQGVSVR